MKAFVVVGFAVGLGALQPAWATAPAACTGQVTIGEGETRVVTDVPNRLAPGGCFNDLIVDTVAEGARYDSHGEFIAEVAKLVARWYRQGLLSWREKRALMAAAWRSEVGHTITVRVIGFNDFHGNLRSPGTFAASTAVPPAARPPVGGADYLAGYVARLKAENPLNAVVGAGDFIGASPLVSALFNDEPTVEVMNRLGLEFNAVGNHEFDRGAAELLRLQAGGCKGDGSGCRGAEVGTPYPFEGAKFQWLAANVIVTASGQPLLPPYGIKKFNQRVRVAFIGLTLKETPTIVTPTGVAGLEFRDEAETINALVPQLRRQGIRTIGVLLHQGGFQSGTLNDINACEGALAGSPVAAIVRRLHDEIDFVLTGHSHAAYNCRLPNAAGRAIPVTSASAFGRLLTVLDVTIDNRSRDVVGIRAQNVLVDRTNPEITPDAQIAGIVAAYEKLVAPIANRVIGSVATTVSHVRADAACNMPAGDLIADAQRAATAAPELGGAVVAFMNGGGVRSPGFTYPSSAAGEGDGNVTYGEAFTVQPFGNSLVTMTLTVQDIKDLLEEQFAGCGGQSPSSTRILLPSAGFRFAWDGGRPCGARISNVTLTRDGATETLVDANGIVLQPTRTVRVTVNSFLAAGGDGFSTLLRGRDLLGGPQDLDALVAYFAAFRAPNPPYDPSAPQLGKPRITRLNAPAGATCPTGANTNP
ncbi:MAG: 5'-nucleotidase C-terminal domain-containing protein [Burkholderiaceae bacterium]|nr:5'-nucleotidase C-terminal domain-containing protein [Burkholderiaceae bacterium]